MQPQPADRKEPCKRSPLKKLSARRLPFHLVNPTEDLPQSPQTKTSFDADEKKQA